MRVLCVALPLLMALGACEAAPTRPVDGAPVRTASSPPVMTAAPSASVAPLVSLPTLHTDAAGLSGKLDLPPGAVSTRWIVRARGGESWAPGPTDYELFAFVSIAPSAWPALEAKLGPPRPGGSVSLPRPVAALLFDATALAAMPSGPEDPRFVGPAYDVRALARMPFRGETGVRVGGGLVIVLWTM